MKLLKFLNENKNTIKTNYRIHSEKYYEHIKFLRENKEVITCNISKQIFENTDLGIFEEFEGQLVPLDLPFVDMLSEEDKTPELNKPKRGGPKKYYVYVKNDKGNIVKVSFGAPGMDVNFADKKKRDAFVARHKCEEKTDKTTSGWWSCALPKYASMLGLKNGGNFYW